MVTALKRLSFTVVFLICGFSATAQPDSLAIDSITQRIRIILEEYNEHVLFVDTSDYVTEGYGIDDINLQIAASKGACNEIIRLYLKGADINNFIGKTATPLHYSVASGKKEAVEILLLLGAKPDVIDIYGNTALASAVRSGDLDIAEMLIRYGASTDMEDKAGSTPLHHSAALGLFYVTDMLLYYEAPTESRDHEGNTPLMTAVSFGYYDIADILLQSGADPGATDRKGFTPLMAAAQNGDTLMMILLINAGAYLYAVNNNGIDALGCAAIAGRKEAAKLLLDMGNRWYYTGKEMTDPANLADYYGHRDVVQVLEDKNMTTQRRFSLEELALTAGCMLTTHYKLADVSVSLTDPWMRTGIKLGAALNPVSQRMLINGDDDITRQFKVSSSLVYAGVFRAFRVGSPVKSSNWNIIPSLSAGYRFYSLYEGTNDKPEDKFCIIPAAEIRWSTNNLSVGSGLTYLNTPFQKVFPVWFTLRASYTLVRESRNNSAKKIRLYRYE